MTKHSQFESLVWRLGRQLPKALPAFLAAQRWFGSKARTIRSARVVEVFPIPQESAQVCLVLAEIMYSEGPAETYTLLLTPAPGWATRVKTSDRAAPFLRLGDGLTLYDALWDRDVAWGLLRMIHSGFRLKGQTGELVAAPGEAFGRLAGDDGALEPRLVAAEQSNSSMLYGERLILKFFRRLEAGTNPDLEVGAFLTEKAHFAHVPPLAGSLELRRAKGEPVSLAMLQGFVVNRGDAWRYTQSALDRFFERLGPKPASLPPSLQAAGSVSALSGQAVPRAAADSIEKYLEHARLLGRRTGELHLALASEPNDPDFAPEPFTNTFQRDLCAGMCRLAGRVFGQLTDRLSDLPAAARIAADQVLQRRNKIEARFRVLLDRQVSAYRTRIHGDYHLGQVLFTGDDFYIIDFEGEPARSLAERRQKRSPLQDVAGMLRSFHYAAYTALNRVSAASALDQAGIPAAWAQMWYRWVSAGFLNDYLQTVGKAVFLPTDPPELVQLLDALLLEKAVYELGYELNNRPAWVHLPLAGILDLLGTDEGYSTSDSILTA